MSEDRDCSVKASPSPITEARLSPRGVEALTLPRLRLYAETKKGHDASSETSSTATYTTRESTASSTTITTYSCSSSDEPTESPTSSTAYPSTCSALDPLSSPVRIPARLRRKCPLYAQLEEQEDQADASLATPVRAVVGKKNDGTAKIEPSFDEGSPPPNAKVNPRIVMVSSPKRGKTEPATQRRRVLPPMPVPHLIKKSRGRRVPEPDEARERAHICSVPGCSKSFARAEHLKRHVISLHTHEKRAFSFLRATPFPIPVTLHQI
jgi:hypothetical protein